MGCEDLKPWHKGCIACGVGSIVVAAIMFPVSYYVIAPNMGQHALDVAVMNIPNSTVFDLAGDLHENNIAKIYNSVELDQTSMPLGSRLHETQLVLNVPAYDAGWTSWPQKNLMWFNMVQQDIKHGMNKFEFTSPLTIFQDTDDFVHWSFVLTLSPPPFYTEIRLAGKPRMSSMGIFYMDLKMGKRLNCTYLPPPPETTTTSAPAPGSSTTTAAPGSWTQEELELLRGTSEESITARRLAMEQVRGMGPVTLECKDNGDIEDDLLDEILQNFTDDLQEHTTLKPTTTHAPPPPPPPPTTAPAPAPPTTSPAPGSATTTPASATTAPASATTAPASATTAPASSTTASVV